MSWAAFNFVALTTIVAVSAVVATATDEHAIWVITSGAAFCLGIVVGGEQ